MSYPKLAVVLFAIALAGCSRTQPATSDPKAPVAATPAVAQDASPPPAEAPVVTHPPLTIVPPAVPAAASVK